MKDEAVLAAVADLLGMGADEVARPGSASFAAFSLARDAIEWVLGLDTGASRLESVLEKLLARLNAIGRRPFGLEEDIGLERFLAEASVRIGPEKIAQLRGECAEAARQNALRRRQAATQPQAAPPAGFAPAAPGACPECGMPHDPGEPHTETVGYRERFMARHGRPPSWDDQAAHCDPCLLAAWAASLSRRARNGIGSN